MYTGGCRRPLGPDFLKHVEAQHVTRTPASVSIRLIAKALLDSNALRHGARTTILISIYRLCMYITEKYIQSPLSMQKGVHIKI
jgi:hypothetical protein